MKEILHLPTKRTESLHIKTFGSIEGQDTVCDIVELSLVTRDGKALKLTALLINPLRSQPINHSRECYDYLLGLKLVDSTEIDNVVEVDTLIGSDLDWNLLSAKGPMAIHTKVGWVLSGPAGQQGKLTLTYHVPLILRVDTYIWRTLEVKPSFTLRRRESHLFRIRTDTFVYHFFCPQTDSGIGTGMHSIDH